LPEYALLLTALAPAASEPAPRPDWDPPRWDRLLELAYWHRLAPLLFHHLGPEGPAPARVIEALREAYVANATRNLYIGAALERILKAFDGADVPAMLLKGVALFDTVYTDPALRQMGDMDLLVPKGKLDDANAVLAELGYGRRREITRDMDTAEWMRAHHRHDPPLMDEHRLVKVELHHQIVKGEASTHFDIDAFWQRGRTIRSGPPHLLPAPEDLLLHACIHFTYDRMTSSFGALAQLGDIAWILDREQVEWQSLISTAREYRLENPVFLALFAAHELGLAIPTEALESLRPPAFNARLGRRMFELRVLRIRAAVPRRSVRDAIAPGRWGLERSWGATGGSSLSLVGAYLRRAAKSLRLVGHVLKEPRTVVRDYRLNRQLGSLTGGLRD
jgi:putative nucleotidyltransferase-like protein